MHHWIMKSEPTSYSIEDLKRDRRTAWEGVRNYQARNFMRDDMRVGDTVFFYHSNCAVPGIVGEGRVCSASYDDTTALDAQSKYYDSKSTRDKNRWQLVDVCYVRTYPRTLSLRELIHDPALAGLAVTQRGSRLSITPVSEAHARHLQRLFHAVSGDTSTNEVAPHHTGKE